MKLNNSSRVWVAALLLYLPVVLFYSRYFFSPLTDLGNIPTGFIQYDLFYYMSNAREYVDDSSFNIFYQNPFTSTYHNNHIYFQPHIFLLGMILKLTGGDPGIIFCVFGFVSGLVCLAITVKFFETFAGLENLPKKITLVLLCWGGGLLTIGGFLYLIYIGQSLSDSLKYAFIFDPYNGWWFLNYGRNLVFPTEAYYHAVFIGAVYALYLKRYPLYLLLVLILCFSHPFSGTSLLLISLVYFFFESFLFKNPEIPAYVLNILIVIGILHFGYYLFYLAQDPNHNILVQQWKKEWVLRWPSMILAYCIPLLFIVVGFLTTEKIKLYLFYPFNRFLLTWLVISLLLANHEIFIANEIQPLHFTRGNIYIPLFLMATPFIINFITRICNKQKLVFIILPLFIITCLSDNIFWMYSKANKVSTIAFLYKDEDTNELFNELNKPEYASSLVISNDYRAGYWVTVYTPLRSWYSHKYNTPHNTIREQQIDTFFASNKIPDQWRNIYCTIILNRNAGGINSVKEVLKNMEETYENSTYIVYKGYFSQT